MSNEQAIERLSEEYGTIEMAKDGVFVAKVEDGFEMFRLEDGVLEKRVEVDEHTCRWELLD